MSTVQLSEIIDQGCMQLVESHLKSLSAKQLDGQAELAGLNIVHGIKSKNCAHLIAQISPIFNATRKHF